MKQNAPNHILVTKDVKLYSVLDEKGHISVNFYGNSSEVNQIILILIPSGRVAQSVGHLTRKSGVLVSIPGLATYFRFSFRFFKRGSCQLLTKYVHEVLVNRLGGLSLPRKSVVRLTDRLDMTLDVYRGRKTTIQQYN